eukprot:749374-Hanusia_phi.AAC.1
MERPVTMDHDGRRVGTKKNRISQHIPAPQLSLGTCTSIAWIFESNAIISGGHGSVAVEEKRKEEGKVGGGGGGGAQEGAGGMRERETCED